MIKWISKLFQSNKTVSKPDMKKFLIVGLGNSGAEYVNTRHNIGFKVLDHLAKKENLTFQPPNWVILPKSELKAERYSY